MNKIIKGIYKTLFRIKKLPYLIIIGQVGVDTIIKKNFKCYGGKNLCIGKASYIGQHSMITARGKCKIGDRFSATSWLTITSMESVEIGNDVLIGSHVTILDDNHGMNPDSNLSYNEQQLNTKPVLIEDGVWVGDNVIILPGVSIGKKSIIGAGSVVTKAIPEYCIAAGNPAKVIKKWDNLKNEWVRL